MMEEKHNGKPVVPASQEECWVMNVKGGHKVCIPRSQLVAHKKKLDANGDPLFVECEPEFVPKKHLKPKDYEKKPHVQQYSNSEKSYTQIEEIINMSMREMKEYAETNGVDIKGLKSKKAILEKLEEEKKLY